MIRMKAPFTTGSAGGYPVIDGICEVDERTAADLEMPPHNFMRIENDPVKSEPSGDSTGYEDQKAHEEDSLLQEAEHLRQENEALKRRKKNR